MSSVLVRQWTLLTMIPSAPRKIDTRALVDRLKGEHGIRTTMRTVQKDLLKLQAVFPLVSDNKPQHHGWSWLKSAPVFNLPGMDPQTALTIKLAATLLPRMLPRSTLRFLDLHVKRADLVLKEKLGTRLHREWARKVRAVPRGLPLGAPKTRDAVLEAVYDAVFEEKCVRARYLPVRGGKPKTRVLHPLALVYRDAIPYLVCTIGDRDGVITLGVHRIEHAEVLEERRRTAPSFDLDEFIDGGSVAFRYGEARLELDALVDIHQPSPMFYPLAQLLREMPLSSDQVLSPHDEGRLRLRARVQDSGDLRAFILSQGDAIEVLEPEHLRNEIADLAESTAAVYRRSSRRHARTTAPGFLHRLDPKR